MAQVTWFAVDDALDVIKNKFALIDAKEKKGIETVIFLQSGCIAQVVRKKDNVIKRHFRKILNGLSDNTDSDIIHLVSPVFTTGHFFFAAISILERKQVLVQSVGERGEATMLRLYVGKLCEYLAIPENRIGLPVERLGLRTDRRGSNACAGYALAIIDEYLASGGNMSNINTNLTKVHEGADEWMRWLRQRDKEKKYNKT